MLTQEKPLSKPQDIRCFVKSPFTNLISEKDQSFIEESTSRLAAKHRAEPKAYSFAISSKQPESSNSLPLNHSFSYFNQPPRSQDTDSLYSDCLATLEFYLRDPFNAGFRLQVNTNYSLFALRKHVVAFIERSGLPPNIELQDFEFFYIGKSIDPHTRICEFLDPQNLNPVINVVFSKLTVSPAQQACVDPSLVPKSRHGGLLSLPRHSALCKM